MTPYTMRLIRHHLQVIASRTELLWVRCDTPEPEKTELQRREVLDSVKRIGELLGTVTVVPVPCPLGKECPLVK